jgi:transposase
MTSMATTAKMGHHLRAAGQPPKVALVAIMRKLLIRANALLRDRRTWSPLPA